MSRIPIFLCLLVLTAVLCEDPPSTKAPEHQNKEHPKQPNTPGSVGNPPEQHHKMAELPKGPDNNQMPKFNQN